MLSISTGSLGGTESSARTLSAGSRRAAAKTRAPARIPRIVRPALLIHRLEEVRIGLRMLQLVDQELHRNDHAHGHEDAAQHPHLAEGALVDQELLLAGARLGDVDGRESALVGELAVEDDFRIA